MLFHKCVGTNAGDVVEARPASDCRAISGTEGLVDRVTRAEMAPNNSDGRSFSTAFDSESTRLNDAIVLAQSNLGMMEAKCIVLVVPLCSWLK
jgi:hypothetical protein